MITMMIIWFSPLANYQKSYAERASNASHHAGYLLRTRYLSLRKKLDTFHRFAIWFY